MSQASHPADRQFEPQHDLVFDRAVDIPPALIWAAWTTEEHIKHWFTPAARPVLTVDFAFTGIIEIEPQGAGSKYTATVLLADAKARERHAAMGFQEGWGSKALDQFVAYMKALQACRDETPRQRHHPRRR